MDDLPKPDRNWNAGYAGEGSSHYTSFDVKGDCVQLFYDKGNINPDYLHIGVVGIYNYQLFWEIAQSVLERESYDSKLSDVDVLKQFLKTEKIHLVESKKWYDVGNVEKILEAKEYFSDSNFQVLDKPTESIYNIGDNIIKYFYDQEVCLNRIKRTKFLSGAVPEVIGYNSNFYKYKLVNGNLFSKIANLSNFQDFLNWAFEKLWNPVTNADPKKFREISYDFYFKKTIDRIQQFRTTRLIDDKIDIINGFEIPSLSELINAVDFEKLCNIIPTTFHGDFILDNIINVNDNDFKLIDWRQDFGGEIEAGDQYYDLAKLAHNLVVNHEIIDKNLFSVKIKNNNNVHLSIHRYQSLVECEQLYFDYLQKRSIDLHKVRILRAIIWLNMSPLHHHPFDLYLYYFGKYNLYLELNSKLNR
jgi:thiamine kinase-like enzyme